MADSIKITLPQGYEPPTEEDIAKAKKWTLLRNENAARLSSLIEERLQDAIRELTQIGYKYNTKPEDFQFSQDKNLREDVAAVMNDLEDDIMSLVEDYSLNESDDENRRNILLPWLAALHSKGTDNLRGTLHERLRQFLFDTEAQIAAMKMANYNQEKAIARNISTMHTVYASPEMLAAFKRPSKAMYIQSKGVHEGNVGLSSSGAVNIENFGDMTARMAWSRSQYEGEKEEGKAGYFCFRGSTFPCALCDDVCEVFHLMEEGMVLPVHGHCCCYAVFVEAKGQSNTIEKKPVSPTLKARRKEIKKEAFKTLRNIVYENDEVSWTAKISGDDIKEWLNEPNFNLAEKNEALLDLPKIFKSAAYLGDTIDPKQAQGLRPDVEKSHIFRTTIAGRSNYIIVHQMQWGEYKIHSITDRNPLK